MAIRKKSSKEVFAIIYVLDATNIKKDEELRNHHGASLGEEKDNHSTWQWVWQRHITALMAAQEKGAGDRQHDLGDIYQGF